MGKWNIMVMFNLVKYKLSKEIYIYIFNDHIFKKNSFLSEASPNSFDNKMS